MINIKTSQEIRNIWLNFFKSKQHKIESSASLIPDKDPTLLWINAGVAPLKKYFNGSVIPHHKRIVNIQKCLRANDIDMVGKTSRHHTFFEMLGNFSIGDYFKKEAIEFAFEFLTSHEFLALDFRKLYITYFEKDLETYEYWLQKGIDKNHLIALKENFWEIGEGPCGPCTEIFFDRGPAYDSRNHNLILNNINNNRFIEIWNIVFSQYNLEIKNNRKVYQELPNKNIDTGVGLERLTCILQNKNNNFETDLFLPIIQKISILSNIIYRLDENQEIFQIISDHIRALVFGIADGVMLSNDGRGYILKKLLRRAFQKGIKLGFNDPFLFKLVPTVVDIMEDFYPYLKSKISIIQQIILTEEQKFLLTLQEGKNKFLEFTKISKKLLAKDFFKLYDTYGLPPDIILEYAKNYKILAEKNEFEKILEKQKKISSNQGKIVFKNKNYQNNEYYNFTLKSEFVGYKCFSTSAKVIKIFENGIILDKTPFYAEMGGQISDFGMINQSYIEKVIKLPHGQFLHYTKDYFELGQQVNTCIDLQKRHLISLNHTATHLLHAALKKLFNPDIQQCGSFLNHKILKFDFNYYKSLSLDDLISIENKINSWINEKYPINVKIMTFKEAQDQKIQLLEQIEYNDIVRVIEIKNISTQLCGGTHAFNTLFLEKFAILSYVSIGSGIYRIEATTTTNNIILGFDSKTKHLRIQEQKILHQIEQYYYDDLNNKVNIPQFKEDKDSYKSIFIYKDYCEELQKLWSKIQKKIYQKNIIKMIKEAEKIIPSKIEPCMFLSCDNIDIDENMLKNLLDYLIQKLKINFLCLYKQKSEYFILVCKSNIDSINAKNFINRVNIIIEGKGGGNANFAKSISYNKDKLIILQQEWLKCL
ncbi:alanine--tRNA ligase ['Opuntia sp.' phytoplasma]|nr:alanine--tRNA ligase ['Opuntia sp.' phytoplasma]MDO8057958.1 alanine--tRNA ligase ['Opuntia sp.' phytoplasma]